MRLLLPLLLSACGLALVASAQTSSSKPAPEPRPSSRPAPILSPEIHADRRVTFRLKAPQATEVSISGQAVGKTAMTKDESGVWSATVGPVEPGVWEYSFVVSGVQMVDPGNPAIKPQRSPRTSILHIPDNPPQSWDYQNVPHGTVHQHTYSSEALGTMREFFVYTPPGYERDSATKFPVLYLVHGFGDNHAAWSAHGKAHWILDNLIAQGKATPMIVVMPDGHPIAPGGGSREEYGFANSKAFERELLEEILPFVESNYRVRKESAGRAIAGLSMGGGHSLHTGLRNIDTFASIGAFSAGVPGKDRTSEAFAKSEAINEKLNLFWIACGKDDFLIQRNRELHAQLTEKGIQHTWLETEGDHSWPVWRRYLTEFAPLLFKNGQP